MLYSLFILIFTISLNLTSAHPRTLPTPSCPPAPPSPLGAKWHNRNTCYYPSKYLPTSFTCETSPASPRTSDVLAAVSNLLARKGEFWCEQGNPGGSKCTEVVSGIAICGPLGSRMLCRTLAGVVEQLVEWCDGGEAGRVGGVVGVGVEEVAGVVRVVGRKVVVY